VLPFRESVLPFRDLTSPSGICVPLQGICAPLCIEKERMPFPLCSFLEMKQSLTSPIIIAIFLEVYKEVKAMKEACGTAHLKTILATGELASLSNVYKASMVCMMAG